MKRQTSLLRYPVILLFVLGALAVSWFHLFDSFELESLDFRYQIRPPAPPTDKVVIIEIGDDTIGFLGRFPFDRDYHAILVNALHSFGAKAVVFDLFFSEPHASDKDFEEALKASDSVYLPTVFELAGVRDHIPHAKGYAGRCLENFEMYARGVGHINVVPDIDGKYRRVPVYVEYKGTFHPQISVKVACDWLGIKDKDINFLPGKALWCGGIRIPLDEKSLMIVNYTGKWGKVFKHYSYVDVLQSFFALSKAQKPILDPALFKDKICVVGLTATGTSDVRANPFETLYPAVGIHPETFNAIVNKRFIERVPREVNLAVLLALGLLVTLSTVFLRPLRSLVLLVASLGTFIVAAIGAFTIYGLWVDIVYPVTATLILYLVLTIYRYVGEWKRRLVMEHELDIAKKIQQSFLPKSLPATPGLEAAATMLTARQVGGDIYDFVEFDNGHLGVMIGDVSGKGIPAALFMAMVAGSFKFLSTTTEPAKMLFDLNAKLVKESHTNLFVTVFYSVFDMPARTLNFANGGHLPLLHLSPGKAPAFLDVQDGAPLGLMDGPYSGGKITFAPGDIFVYYTDGITEAMNRKAEMYEKERLVKVATAHSALPAAGIVKAIERDVRRFEPVSTQHDDITVIVVKVI